MSLRLKRPANVFEHKWLVYDLKLREKICLKQMMSSKPLSLNRSFIYDMAGDSFEITYQKGNLMYSLFRTKEREEAIRVFHSIESNIRAIMKGYTHQNWRRRRTARILHQIIECCQTHSTWTAAHVAAHLRMHRLFSRRVAEVIEHLDAVSPQTKDSPIHVALQAKHRKTVRAILKLNPNVKMINLRGNSVLHEAAVTKSSIFQLIWTIVRSLEPEMIEWRNNDDCTPIHLACFNGKTDIVKIMLQSGLTVSQMTVRPPAKVPEASLPKESESNSPAVNCCNIIRRSGVEDRKIEFTKEMIAELDDSEMVLGGSPLHWVKSRSLLTSLLDWGFDLKVPNFRQETAIHVAARKKRFKILLGIIVHDSTTTSLTNEIRETALHTAVQSQDILTVQALMVFESDIDAVNSLKQSARHLAASIRTESANVILFMLNSIGAKRCPQEMENCNSGCAFDGTFDGVGLPQWMTYEKESFYNEILLKGTIRQAVEKQKQQQAPGESETQSETKVRDKQEPAVTPDPNASSMDSGSRKRVNMLTLDGGGVRGLISCQILCEMDRLLKFPIFNYFDWTIGTSTGSVIASLLCLKHSPADIRKTYFKFKDEIICGRRPYSSKKMNTFLKLMVGESTIMNALGDRKLVITSTIADRIPPQLYLFRSYPSPDEISSRIAVGQRGHPQSNCDKQYLWSAIRASSAAPCYFTSHENFIDGGVISNNPTLDAMTEFCNRNQTLLSQGREGEMEDLSLVLNIGTGRLPTKFNEKNCLLSFESPLFSANVRKTLRNVKNFLNLLVVMLDQCTLTEFHVVERSMAWCKDLNIPHFRICPPLSDHVRLDDADDETVINFMYETKAYMHSLYPQLVDVVQLLESSLQETPIEANRHYYPLILPNRLPEE